MNPRMEGMGKDKSEVPGKSNKDWISTEAMWIHDDMQRKYIIIIMMVYSILKLSTLEIMKRGTTYTWLKYIDQFI